jgi:hypothetical protein
LGACAPSEGAAGSKVVCEAGSIEEDCTVFFGNAPVEFALNEDGTLSFTVPATLPGEKSVHSQCGDSGVTPLGKFSVTGGGSGDGSVVPPAIGAPSADGEVIQPSGGTADEEGAVEAPAPSEAPEAPAAPTSASIASFEVTKAASARLNTVKISWNFSNAKSAYVWGDFNREASDSHCGLVGGRHLVTDQDGNKLNEGSALYAQNLPFLEGTLCDNANADSADDCKGQTSTAARESRSPLYASRFDHGSAMGDLYFYDQIKIENLEKFKLAQEGSALTQLSPGIGLLIEEENPNCRIELVREDASLIASGDVYTRSLVRYGRFCLAVQGEDDQWTVQCKNAEAPEAGITNRSIQAVSGQAAVKLTIDYANGVGIDVTGCSQTAHTLGSNGLGHYEGQCAVDSVTKAVKAVVRGIGKTNVDKKSFAVELGTPFVSLKPEGSPPLKNEERDFDLEHKAIRALVVKEEGSVVLETDVSWFQQVYFEGFASGNGWQSVSPSGVTGTKTVHQDVSHNLWRFGVRDFDGSEKTVKFESAGFPKTFSLSLQSGGGGMTFLGGEYCNDAAVHIYHWFQWSGENVQSLSVKGQDGQTVWAGSQSDLPNDQHGPDFGSLVVYRDLGFKDDTWSAGMKFTVDVVFKDGSKHSYLKSTNGWSCN